MRKLFSKLFKKSKNPFVVPFKGPTTRALYKSNKTDLSEESLSAMQKRILDRLEGLSNE
mgnify:FL=1